MKAIMLAAGRGTRLSKHDDGFRPKSLLRFGGMTMLQRHIEILRACGIEELTLVVGYHADEIIKETVTIGAGDFVRPVHNPDFHQGSLVSLWTAREALTAGGTVLVMDADVLCHPDLVRRLVETGHDSCLLMDRDLEDGEEPVKLCAKDGVAVEFGKTVSDVAFDAIGEAAGFLRASPGFARALVDALQSHMDAGRLDEHYEEAIRDVILDGASEPVGVEDITGIPWIEIDFQQDLERAEQDIYPRIMAMGGPG